MAGNSLDDNKAYKKKLHRYEYYAEERRASINAENATISSFEKTLTTLSSGALGFSITFIRFIATEPVSKDILYVAWTLFGLALLEVLSGFLLAQLAQVRYREMLDEWYKNPGFDAKNLPSILCSYLNWVSLVTFIAGVVLFAIFVALNFQPTGTQTG